MRDSLKLLLSEYVKSSDLLVELIRIIELDVAMKYNLAVREELLKGLSNESNNTK